MRKKGRRVRLGLLDQTGLGGCVPVACDANNRGRYRVRSGETESNDRGHCTSLRIRWVVASLFLRVVSLLLWTASTNATGRFQAAFRLSNALEKTACGMLSCSSCRVSNLWIKGVTRFPLFNPLAMVNSQRADFQIFFFCLLSEYSDLCVTRSR